MKFEIPRLDHRVAVTGKTGTGKTVFGVWLLSISQFDKQPFVIIDYKRDRLIADIPAHEIGLHEKLPTKPGVYVTRPDPREDDAHIENYMWRIWERERIGVFFDEMYLINARSKAYRALQTQGRSKKIPTISLSQRPFLVPKFTFTEADFYSVFWLNNPDDRKAIGGYVPNHILDDQLEKYHSHWYDGNQHAVFKMRPAPQADLILQRFEDRLKAKKRMV